MQSVKISGKRRKVNIGDLWALIKIENRKILPSSINTEYSLEFTDTDTNLGTGQLANGEVWACPNTVRGKTVFDNTGIEIEITDIFRIYYLDITSEQWILYNNNRYNIITVENYEGRNEFLDLNCVFKGPITNFNNVY